MIKEGAAPDGLECYEIRIKGHLNGERLRWFEELTVSALPNGETVLSGPLADQAALHGLLNRIRDLGAPLLSVNRWEGKDQE